jgi:hypothetical protein
MPVNSTWRSSASSWLTLEKTHPLKGGTSPRFA